MLTTGGWTNGVTRRYLTLRASPSYGSGTDPEKAARFALDATEPVVLMSSQCISIPTYRLT